MSGDLPSFDVREKDNVPRKPALEGRTSTDSIDFSELYSSPEQRDSLTNLIQTSPLGKLLNSVPVPTLLVDESYSIVFPNESCSKVSPNYEKILGTNFSSLFPFHVAAARAQSVMAEVFSRRRPDVHEGVVEIEKNRIWARLHLRTLKWGTHILVVVLFEDLTLEKKRLLLTKKHEQRLQTAYEELESLIQERTEELQRRNERLNTEISQRKLTEGALQQARGELEGKVRHRTIELAGAVRELESEVAQRKRIEEALRKSEEKYRLLVQHASDAIIVADNNSCKFVNPKATELTGYSSKELATRSLLDLVNDRDLDLVSGILKKIVSEKSATVTYVFRLLDKQGDTKWVQASTVSITWEARAATLSFLTDMSMKRKMEEEMLKVQKLESLALLAGGIAHDFNNFLTGILGNISVSKAYLKKILHSFAEEEKACAGGQRLAQQLITFSKGGAPVKKAVDISVLIEESRQLTLAGSNLSCELSIPDQLWMAAADSGQISQVLTNILLNSVQAMPNGGLVSISAKNLSVHVGENAHLAPGNYIKISLKDNGPGIQREILPKIFDPYFSTKEIGNGLGLTTSYSIVRNHGGCIEAASELQKGTVFHVWLPAWMDASDSEPRLTEERPANGGKILFMDDEESIRDLAGELLSLLGYEVVVARDGKEAIALYSEAKKSSNKFDALILDLTILGGIGGKEVVQQLKSIDPGIKAIVSSGYAEDPVLADYQKYGFVGAIPKPYDISLLGGVLKKVLPSRE